MHPFLYIPTPTLVTALRFNRFVSTPFSSPIRSLNSFYTVRAMATRIPPPAVHDRLTSQTPPLYIDVRTPQEFADGHVPNAVNVPVTSSPGVVVPTFVDDVKALATDRLLILGCKSGKRSTMAIDLLEKAGFQDLTEMDGGFEAWLANNDLPVER